MLQTIDACRNAEVLEFKISEHLLRILAYGLPEPKCRSQYLINQKIRISRVTSGHLFPLAMRHDLGCSSHFPFNIRLCGYLNVRHCVADNISMRILVVDDRIWVSPASGPSSSRALDPSRSKP